MSKISIASWNVNGIRAAAKKGFVEWIEAGKYDIVCLQETKVFEKSQLSDEILNPDGYKYSYFAHHKIKKGYSGVAIYSKTEPEKVKYGLGDPKFDDEGRIVVAYFPDFVLLNVYFPNGGMGPERLKYKFEFYEYFLKSVKKLEKKGKNVIFCGDVNTAHTEIDLARPKENVKNTGFLPEERAWIDRVMQSGFIDTFRYFHPGKTESYSYWDMKTFARDRNVGWRIDYFFVSKSLEGKIKKASIESEVFGSDHCPVTLTLNI